MDIDWDYDHRKVHFSMLLYVTEALTRFLHNSPRKPQRQPYPPIKPNYGAKAQYSEAADVFPPLSIADKKNSKSHGGFSVLCVGSRSYYADSTWIHRNTSSEPNGAHNEKSETILRLFGHPPSCRNHITRR